MNELATVVFASQSGAHLVDAPRSRRFAAFCQGFDQGAYLRDLEARGFAWIPRSAAAFPARLRAIHDPPPGLFVRGASPLAIDDAPVVAIVGARACSPYGSEVAHDLARELAAASAVWARG